MTIDHSKRSFLNKLAALPLVGALPFVKARAEQQVITGEINNGISASKPIPWPQHGEELRIRVLMSNDDGTWPAVPESIDIDAINESLEVVEEDIPHEFSEEALEAIGNQLENTDIPQSS